MPTLTVPVRELVKILTATRPFTEPDFGQPKLTCIRLEAGQGVLTATACDRYFLAHARTTADGTLTPHYITRTETRRLLRLLRPLHEAAAGTLLPSLGTDPVATVVADGESFKDLLITVGTLRIAIRGQHWPEWVKQVDTVATRPDSTADDRARVLLDAGRVEQVVKLLAKLERRFPPRENVRSLPAMRLTANGQGKPVRFEYGDWLLIMLMPARINNDPGRVPYGLPDPPPTVAELNKIGAEIAKAVSE